LRIIDKMRRQNAIYWPPLAADRFGVQVPGALVELAMVCGDKNYRVRWVDVTEEFLGTDNTTQMSNAYVYVPVLPDGSEVVVGGYLWLGDRSGLTDEKDPRNNPGAWEVRKFEKTPTLRASKFIRKAVL